MTDVLHRRLREMRARVLTREFDYRQRHLARGVWFRLRRALALADEAYAVPRDAGEQLAAEGCEVLPLGSELEPPRLILIAPRDRVAALPVARPLPVRPTAELLAAECVVLVPFEPQRAS